MFSFLLFHLTFAMILKGLSFLSAKGHFRITVFYQQYLHDTLAPHIQFWCPEVWSNAELQSPAPCSVKVEILPRNTGSLNVLVPGSVKYDNWFGPNSHWEAERCPISFVAKETKISIILLQIVILWFKPRCPVSYNICIFTIVVAFFPGFL